MAESMSIFPLPSVMAFLQQSFELGTWKFICRYIKKPANPARKSFLYVLTAKHVSGHDFEVITDDFNVTAIRSAARRPVYIGLEQSIRKKQPGESTCRQRFEPKYTLIRSNSTNYRSSDIKPYGSTFQTSTSDNCSLRYSRSFPLPAINNSEREPPGYGAHRLRPNLPSCVWRQKHGVCEMQWTRWATEATDLPLRHSNRLKVSFQVLKAPVWRRLSLLRHCAVQSRTSWHALHTFLLLPSSWRWYPVQ